VLLLLIGPWHRRAHMLKALILERPAFGNIHLCSRKPAFRKPLKRRRSRPGDDAIVLFEVDSSESSNAASGILHP